MGVDSEYVRGAVEKGLFGQTNAHARIGRFEITGRLGRGGMGIVYEAYDPQLDRAVAIKLLSPALAEGEAERTRLRAEARAMAQLSHPNVVGVFELSEHEGQLFLAMELIEGESLRRFLESGTRSVAEILDVFEAAGEGLAAAHDRGLVHRDFKPDNVMVGADRTVKVVDFGLARRDTDPQQVARLAEDDGEVGADTTRGTILGTPAYMSPQQLHGMPADAKSDQFAFCATLYEALQGRRPFEGDSLTQLRSNLERGPSSDRTRWNGPRWLKAVVRRGLERDPDRRWPDMRAVLRAIRRGRRRRLWWLASAAGIMVAGGIVAGVAAPSDDACPPSDEMLDDVWDHPMRRRLRQRFSDDPFPYTRPTYDVVEAEVDELAKDWAATWSEACRPETPLRLRLRAQDCLQQSRQQLRFLAGAMGLIPVNLAVFQAHQTIALLPDPRECLDPGVVESTPPPPDETESGKVQSLRSALVFSFAREATTSEELAEIYEPLIEEAESLRYPILAEVLSTYATRLADGRFAELWDVSQRAIEVAERTRHDRALATVLVRRAAATVAEGSFQDAPENFRRAEVGLERAGRPIHLEIRLLLAQSNLAAAERRFDEALDFVEQARTRVVSRYGETDARLLVMEQEAINVAGAALDLEEMEAAVERVNDIAAEVVASHHPFVAYSRRERARVAFASGDRQEAARQWALMEEAFAKQVDAEGRVDPYLRGWHDMQLLDDYYGLARCEEGKRLLAQALPRALPRWRLELHAIGVWLGALACFDEAMTSEHARAGLALIEDGLPATSVRAGQILGALSYWYECNGTAAEATEFRQRAQAYADSTIAGKVPVLAWRIATHFDKGELEEAWALRGVIPRGDWAGPAGRHNAASGRVWLADLALQLGHFDEARAYIDDALGRFRRCCADTLAAAHANFVHAKLLWRDPERRREALELARATQTMYADHGVKQTRLTGLVDAWLAEHAIDPAP